MGASRCLTPSKTVSGVIPKYNTGRVPLGHLACSAADFGFNPTADGCRWLACDLA